MGGGQFVNIDFTEGQKVKMIFEKKLQLMVSDNYYFR
jgi:hypothetical protein